MTEGLNTFVKIEPFDTKNPPFMIRLASVHEVDAPTEAEPAAIFLRDWDLPPVERIKREAKISITNECYKKLHQQILGEPDHLDPQLMFVAKAP
jgi:hypothetical protein